MTESERNAPKEPPTPRRVLGAAMLGVGALFQPNADPEAHWSESPKVVLEVETRVRAEGTGLDLDDSAVPAAPPATLRPRRRRRLWFARRRSG